MLVVYPDPPSFCIIHKEIQSGVLVPGHYYNPVHVVAGAAAKKRLYAIAEQGWLISEAELVHMRSLVTSGTSGDLPIRRTDEVRLGTRVPEGGVSCNAHSVSP